MAISICRKQPPVNQLVSVRLREMGSDVLSVIRIPTFQIIILQVEFPIPHLSPFFRLLSPLL